MKICDKNTPKISQNEKWGRERNKTTPHLKTEYFSIEVRTALLSANP